MAKNWDWPFPSVGEGHFMQVQSFGYDGGYRQNSYHDGLDFGSVDHPGSEVHAIHSGTVTRKGYLDGLLWYFTTENNDGYTIVYQEAFSTAADIYVKVGDHITTGDIVGRRTTSHLHVGITTIDFMQAVANSFSSAGGWVDPQAMIKNGGGEIAASDQSSSSENKQVNQDVRCLALWQVQQQLHDKVPTMDFEITYLRGFL